MVCFIDLQQACFKERASMDLDTHTVFLIHVWTWREEWQEGTGIHGATLKQTTAKWNYALNAKEREEEGKKNKMLFFRESNIAKSNYK